MKNIYDELSRVKKDFGVDDVVKYLKDNPQVASKNAHIIRNEGYLRSLEEDKKFDQSFEYWPEVVGQSQVVDSRGKYVAF